MSLALGEWVNHRPYRDRLAGDRATPSDLPAILAEPGRAPTLPSRAQSVFAALAVRGSKAGSKDPTNAVRADHVCLKWLASDQATSRGDHGCLRAVIRTHFAHGVRQMEYHRALGDTEDLRDLPGRLTTPRPM